MGTVTHHSMLPCSQTDTVTLTFRQHDEKAYCVRHMFACGCLCGGERVVRIDCQTHNRMARLHRDSKLSTTTHHCHAAECLPVASTTRILSKSGCPRDRSCVPDQTWSVLASGCCADRPLG